MPWRYRLLLRLPSGATRRGESSGARQDCSAYPGSYLPTEQA